MATQPEARRELGAELAWGAATALIAFGLAAIALHLWDADLRVPFSYKGDGVLNQVAVKSMLDHGWFQSNPDLAAPFGQSLLDFPVFSGDTIQFVLMKVIGVFSSDSALVENLFFLLTFPLAAATCFGAARALGVARLGAAAAAILFALLPYHFLRGEFHLFIAAYWAVPLGGLLAVSVMAGRFFPTLTAGRQRMLLVVLLCLIVGSAHVYYAVFTLMLVLTGTLVRLAAGDRATAKSGALVIALITLTVGLNHLPNLVNNIENGKNQAIARDASESEDYGLKLVAMVLPAPGHRVAPLADLRDRYSPTKGGGVSQEIDSQALGLVATLGLAGLMVAALLAVAWPARFRIPPLILPLAACTLVAFLIATVGGLSAVFAYLVTDELRAWGRMAIFIGFFALLAGAVAAGALAPRTSPRTFFGCLLLIVAIGFLDQTNSRSVPAYAANAKAYASDAKFAAALARGLPPGSAVFQFPYTPFPEPQPAFAPPDFGPYDLGRGYLHSDGLRWSWGDIKGLHDDWQAVAATLPVPLAVQAIAATGFDGIYVDRGAYADGGTTVLTALTNAIGVQPSLSPNTRMAFYPLAPLRARLGARARALRQAVLSPLSLSPGGGVSALRQNATERFYLAEQTGELVLTNPSSRSRRAFVQIGVAAPTPAGADVDLAFPGGATLKRHVGATPITIGQELEVPAGVSTIGIAVKGPPQRQLPDVGRAYYLRVVNPTIADEAFGPAARTATGPGANFLSPFEAR
jgi:phosphoglycerol transferase